MPVNYGFDIKYKYLTYIALKNKISV